MSVDLTLLTIADFEGHVGAAFTPGLTLIEVRALGRGAERQAFSLLFEADAQGFEARPQGMQTLTHPELGPLSLFVVPIGLRRFEAIFS